MVKLSVIAATTLAFFAMVGFEDSVNMAEECQDPTRIFPKILLTGLGITGLIYILVSISAITLVSPEDLGEGETPLLKVVQALAPAFGPLAKGIADLLVAVAPLIPPLAQLVAMLATQLGTGLSVLAAELGPVISLLGGAFLQAFQILAPVIKSMADNVLPLAAFSLAVFALSARRFQKRLG